jgi:hypothetical protein
LLAALTYTDTPAVAWEDWIEAAKTQLNLTTLPVQQRELPTVSLLDGLQPCLDPRPRNGLIGAIVADGKLLTEPDLLVSTGYPLMNDRALQRVQTWNFSTVERPTAYRFMVEVVYQEEACIDLKTDLQGDNAVPEKAAPSTATES